MLRAEGLRHAFGRVRALDDISFLLTPGQTLAVFGPNGAGKTTLLKVLAGLIRPQTGTTHVEGGRGAIGWMGHHAHLYGHLTVRENLLFWAALYDVPSALRRARVDEALRRHGLTDRADEPVHALSRGLVQRAGIARALLHEPRVLLLDEPFTGLDLAAAAELRRLLAQLAGAGRIVVLATHNVDEGVELATDIAFQQGGRFVSYGPRGVRTAGAVAAEYRRAVAGG
jgi:heme exporter protein A